jgi:hypothetical protein
MAFPISAPNVAVLSEEETVPVHQVKAFWGESNATFVVLLGSPVPDAIQLEFGVNWVTWLALVAESALFFAADAFLAAILVSPCYRVDCFTTQGIGMNRLRRLVATNHSVTNEG